jgi:hypothetical protein
MAVTSTAVKASLEVALCIMKAKKPSTLAEGLFCHMFYTDESNLRETYGKMCALTL